MKPAIEAMSMGKEEEIKVGAYRYYNWLCGILDGCAAEEGCDGCEDLADCRRQYDIRCDTNWYQDRWPGISPLQVFPKHSFRVTEGMVKRYNATL